MITLVHVNKKIVFSKIKENQWFNPFFFHENQLISKAEVIKKEIKVEENKENGKNKTKKKKEKRGRKERKEEKKGRGKKI